MNDSRTDSDPSAGETNRRPKAKAPSPWSVRGVSREARAKAATLDLPVAGVTVRDQRTRWGSCSARGRLSLSWRLVLAPPDVRDYVVSHEVAHLKELNHGPNFWALVEWFCPGHARPRRWLRDNAKILQRYG